MKKLIQAILFSLFLTNPAFAADDNKYNIIENGKFEEILNIISENVKDEYDNMFKQASKVHDIVSKYIDEHLKIIIDAFNDREG